MLVRFSTALADSHSRWDPLRGGAAFFTHLNGRSMRREYTAMLNRMCRFLLVCEHCGRFCARRLMPIAWASYTGKTLQVTGAPGGKRCRQLEDSLHARCHGGGDAACNGQRERSGYVDFATKGYAPRMSSASANCSRNLPRSHTAREDEDRGLESAAIASSETSRSNGSAPRCGLIVQHLHIERSRIHEAA